MRLRSITRQAISTVLAAELVCALLFSVTALVHERQTRLRSLDVMIEGRTDSLLGAIQDAEDPEDTIALDPGEVRVPAGDSYAVFDGNGRVLGEAEGASGWLRRDRRDGFSTESWRGHSYRVLQTRGVRVIDRENAGGGLRRPVRIVYAAPEGRIWHEVMEAAGYNVLLSAVLILGTAIVLVVRLRKVLEPIGELAFKASEISVRSLAFEPPRAALEVAELRPLAETLTAMVGRLRTSFVQQHRFVGDAAHELKTAIAVVRSSIQLLLLRPRGEAEYRSGIEEILADNARVEELAARMLTLARVEERGAAPGETADLADAAIAALGRLKRLARSHGVAMVMESAAPVQVGASVEDLEILVSNLLTNAVEHSSREGTVRIAVLESHGAAVMRVEDEGEGIAASALPHVFERFYRTDSSRTRRTGGAGLGLAICKAIAEAAGGSISIESAPGRGTAVTVSLPAQRATAAHVRRNDSGEVNVVTREWIAGSSPHSRGVKS